MQPGVNLVHACAATRRLVSEMAETVCDKQIPVYLDQMVDDVFLSGAAKGQPQLELPPSRPAQVRRATQRDVCAIS